MKHITILSLLVACSVQQLHSAQTRVHPCSQTKFFAAFPKKANNTLSKSIFLQNMIQEELESITIYQRLNAANIHYNKTSPVSGSGSYLQGRKEETAS